MQTTCPNCRTNSARLTQVNRGRLWRVECQHPKCMMITVSPSKALALNPRPAPCKPQLLTDALINPAWLADGRGLTNHRVMA